MLGVDACLIAFSLNGIYHVLLRPTRMQLPFDFHALEEDLPKIAATSVLIPILQWAVTQGWNYRRKTRISALRKDICELNDFISKQKPYTGDPGVDQSIHIAQAERSRIIGNLNNSFEPDRTATRTLAAMLLFNKPRSFQALFARVVAYIVLVSMLKDSYDHYKHSRHYFHIPDILFYTLIFLGFHYIARRANTITGEHNQRRWWQALTLIYRNPLRIGATLQALFLYTAMTITFSMITTYRDPINGFGYYNLLFLIFFGFYFWLMARYFDRKPVKTTPGNPQVDPSTNEFASIPERISKRTEESK
jgi:hypothetical protein